MKELTLRQQRAADSLDRIKAAAETVIYREGVLSFTTSQVAKEAGVSIGSVYRYFKNRVDLVDSLFPGFSDKATDDFQFLMEEKQRGALSVKDGVIMVDPDPGANPSHPSILRAF